MGAKSMIRFLIAGFLAVGLTGPVSALDKPKGKVVLTVTGKITALDGEARTIVIFFCSWIGITWAFAGALFVANAAFNNLGRPALSTWFNWGKATLGTIPFAIVGSRLAAVEGMMAAIGVGSIVFGIASVWVAARIVNRLESGTSHAHGHH